MGGVKEIIDRNRLHPESSATPAATGEPSHHHDDASSVDNNVLEKEPVVVLTKRQKVKRHCGRFKWWYVVGVVIFLAILLPILFKVIIPAIIKSVVDDQELPIVSGSLVFTDADRISISLETALDTPLGVRIEPVGLQLHAPKVEGQDDDDDKAPFVTVNLPEQHIKGDTKVPIPQQTAMIEDNGQLISWFHAFFDNNETELRVKADPLVAHLGALKYKVGLDKTIKVQGLNSLEGFGLNDMSFIIPADPDTGYNMRGQLMIPNAGVLTLNLGNVSFNMWCGDLNLGLVQTNNLILRPGNNTPSFEGTLYFDQLVPNLGAILDAQKGAIAEGVIQLNATGNTTTYEGRRITYLENVLNSKKLLVELPVITLVTELLTGLLASGGDGPEGHLMDSLGQVIGNTTLFDNMLSHFGDGASTNDQSSSDSSDSSDSSPASNDTASASARVRRSTITTKSKTPARTMRTNLFRLGMRTFKASRR